MAAKEVAEKFKEEAMGIMVICLPASWIQFPDGNIRPRAVKMQDRIAKALSDQYETGRQEERTGKRFCPRCNNLGEIYTNNIWIPCSACS
jgi:hypothetical protein